MIWVRIISNATKWFASSRNPQFNLTNFNSKFPQVKSTPKPNQLKENNLIIQDDYQKIGYNHTLRLSLYFIKENESGYMHHYLNVDSISEKLIANFLKKKSRFIQI